MKRLERVLLKLVIVHFLILIGVQILLSHVPWFQYVNKLSQYEGVSGMEEQGKQDVFRQNTHLHK